MDRHDQRRFQSSSETEVMAPVLCLVSSRLRAVRPLYKSRFIADCNGQDEALNANRP